MRSPGSGRKPIDPKLIDNSKYKKSPDELQKISESIPRIHSCELKPPANLTKGAKREWKRIIKLYGELPSQILSDLDIELLKSYCMYVDIRDRMYNEVSQIENLFTVTTSTSASTVNRFGGKVGENHAGATQRVGQTKKTEINPLLREIRQVEARITVLSNELCLTPAGRVRMGIAKIKEAKDPLDGYYNTYPGVDED